MDLRSRRCHSSKHSTTTMGACCQTATWLQHVYNSPDGACAGFVADAIGTFHYGGFHDRCLIGLFRLLLQVWGYNCTTSLHMSRLAYATRQTQHFKSGSFDTPSTSCARRERSDLARAKDSHVSRQATCMTCVQLSHASGSVEDVEMPTDSEAMQIGHSSPPVSRARRSASDITYSQSTSAM